MPLLLLAAETVETVVAVVPRPAIAIDHIPGHRQIRAVATATVAAASVMEAATVIRVSSASYRLLEPP